MAAVRKAELPLWHALKTMETRWQRNKEQSGHSHLQNWSMGRLNTLGWRPLGGVAIGSRFIGELLAPAPMVWSRLSRLGGELPILSFRFNPGESRLPVREVFEIWRVWRVWRGAQRRQNGG